MLRNLNAVRDGKRIMGTPSEGVLGAAIPAGSLLANDVAVNGLAASYVRLWITAHTFTSLWVMDNGAYTFTAPGDGVYTATGVLIVDGVDQNAPAIVLMVTIGNGVEINAVVVMQGVTVGTLAAQINIANLTAPPLQISWRVVPVGTRKTAIHLEALDVDEVDDLTFRVGPALLPGEGILSASITCATRVSIDPDPAALLVGAYSITGTNVLQRIQGAVPGVTYLLRCDVTLTSGRVLVGSALIRVVRQS